MMQDRIAALLQESEQIAIEVRRNNWSVVQHLAEERQRHLEDFFSNPISPDDAPAVAQMTRDILEIDKQLVNIINLEKSNTVAAFRDIKNQSNATKTYQHVASYSVG